MFRPRSRLVRDSFAEPSRNDPRATEGGRAAAISRSRPVTVLGRQQLVRHAIHVGRGLRAPTAPDPDGTSRLERAAGATGHVEGVSQPGDAAGEEIHHHVKPGETLYSIARQYGTTVEALKDSNPVLNSRALEAGDVLTVQTSR